MPKPQLAIIVDLAGVPLIVGRVHDRHAVRHALDRAIGEARGQARHQGPLAAAAADAQIGMLRGLLTQVGGDIHGVDVPQIVM